MIHHIVKQNSDEWLHLRLGIPTASEFKKIVSPTGKSSTQANGYKFRLLAEWLYGCPLIEEETQWMQRGHALESQAAEAYAFEKDVQPQVAGFITSDDGMVGCSPDRLIGDDGLLEIKCPAPQTHVAYMLSRHVDGDYTPQIQGQLWLCGRKWVDVISYCPGLPSVIVRVERNEDYIQKLIVGLEYFVGDLVKARAEIQERYGISPRTPEASK